MEPLLTVQEVAEKLRISYRSVLNIIHEGDLKSYKIGGLFRISISSIHDYLNSSEVKSYWKSNRRKNTTLNKQIDTTAITPMKKSIET